MGYASYTYREQEGAGGRTNWGEPRSSMNGRSPWLGVLVFEGIGRKRLHRQRRPRQLLVTVGRRQQDAGHHDRRLTKIVVLQMVERIDARMVHPGFVVERILDELIAGDRNR